MIRRVLYTTCLIIFFVTVSGIFSYMTIRFLVGGQPDVSVPDVSGLHVIDAIKTATDLGLNIRIERLEYSSRIPADHVISQRPLAGMDVKKGRDINLVISKGAAMTDMPDLKNYTLKQARLLAIETGLGDIKITRTSHPIVPEEKIISQWPLPGMTVAKGSALDLLVSTGPAQKAYIMPDLSGLQVDQAALALSRYHLVITDINAVYEESVTGKTITGQYPLPGSRIKAGDPVRVIVAMNRASAGLFAENFCKLVVLRLPSGILKHHVKIDMVWNGIKSTLTDGWMKPGTELWMIIPWDPACALFVYLNGKLTQTEAYGTRLRINR